MLWCSEAKGNILKPTICYLTILICILTIANSAISEGLHRFHLNYVIVNDRLKGSCGNFEELMSLTETNPEAAEFICDFWWRRVLKACSEEVDRAIKKRLKSLPFNSTEEQKRKAASDAIDDVSNCIHSYIFDNWDDINQTIVDSYKCSKQDQKAE